jgi:protease I
MSKRKKVAILATDGFEQSELIEPRTILKEQGIDVDIIAPKDGSIKGWDMKDWGKDVSVDIRLEDADFQDYDGLILPGGVINPDSLRTNEDALSFIKNFIKAGKPVGAICHGPWLLINADAVKGKKVTSWPSIKQDLIHAGGQWVDKEVINDDNIITSRNPDDIPAFTREIIKHL